MAKRVQLVSYNMQVREDETHRGYDLSEWPDGEGVCRQVHDWSQLLTSDLMIDEQKEKCFTSCECTCNNNAVHGRVWGGDYGVTAPGINVETGEEDYQREDVHTEAIPFYFQVRAVPGTNRAILLLQKFGRRAIKTLFEKRVSAFLRERYPDPKLHVNPMAPRDYLLQMVRGGIREIRFINRNATGDRADRVRHGNLPPEEGKNQTVFQAERGGILQEATKMLSDALRRNASQAELAKITGIDFDELKVDVRVGGSTRVVNITSPELVARFDVDDEVERGDDGHPLPGSIHRVADGLIEDILNDQEVAE